LVPYPVTQYLYSEQQEGSGSESRKVTNPSRSKSGTQGEKRYKGQEQESRKYNKKGKKRERTKRLRGVNIGLACIKEKKNIGLARVKVYSNNAFWKGPGNGLQKINTSLPT
jgi:hypothetical protein